MAWKRELNSSYRWRNGTEFICLDSFAEDCDSHDPNECECTEIWLGDDKTGSYDSEGVFNSFAKAERHLKQLMKENPDGWMEKDKKPTFILS